MVNRNDLSPINFLHESKGVVNNMDRKSYLENRDVLLQPLVRLKILRPDFDFPYAKRQNLKCKVSNA